MRIATPASPYREHELSLWGGKGHSLIAISQWGVTVPPFFVIPASLFASLGPLPTQLDGGAMRHLIWEKANTPAIRDTLKALIEEGLQAIGQAEWVAVRSSASDEDAGGASLAGQMDTFLNVPCNVDDILPRVIFCWQSLFSDRAVSYRQQMKLDSANQSMAVVVQVMVPAERSMVAFSANPLNRSADEMLVSAVWGLGEALVSGAVDADQYVLTAATGKTVETTLGGQAQMGVRGEKFGVSMVPVPAEKQGQPVLNEAELTKVQAMLATLARSSGRPVDVEAAMVGDALYCLQCRPITTPIGGRKLLWDNSNIVESYAGVTTPLTFTFASFCYDVVYTLFGRMLGVSPEVHRRHSREMKTYLGLMNGRVYYNLLTWYRSMAYLPGFAFTRTAMENMMGVKESLNYELPKAGTTWDKWTKDLPEMVGMIGRIIYYFATIDTMVDDFQARFNKVYLKYRDASFTGWDANRCLDLWTEFQNDLLHHWQAPIMSDTGAMIGYALLRKSCEKWLPDLPGIQNDLLAGEGGIESTQPTKRLLALAQKLQAIPEARESLTNLETFRRAMEEDPRFAGIQTDWNDWLVRYGDRCMNELKLEEPSLREKPDFLLQMLRNYLNMPSIDLHAMEAQEQAVRAKAEADADARLSLWRRFWFRRIVRWARKHVKNRENLRFGRTRMFGLMRRVFLTVGDDFQREGVLQARDDVFYLTIDELVAYVDGRSVTRNLAALVALRKAEFDAYRPDEPDERFLTTGLPHWNQTMRNPNATAVGDGDLVGTPCCPGIIEGPTKLVRDPGDDMTLNGEILVAPRTDPGWVALYPAVKGLLIEKGSVLSHSAIVARELGLPTIVGIKGLCERVAHGQRVRMDGAAGRVEILE